MDAGAPTNETPAWRALGQDAYSHNAGHRAAALEALATILGDEQAVEIVADGLKDQNAHVRQIAAEKLGEMHATSAIPDVSTGRAKVVYPTKR